MAERARKRYEDLTPEQRAAVDRIRARHATPEYRAEEERVRALVEEEFPPKYPRGSRRVDEAPPELAVVLSRAREERARRGLSLADIKASSGLDKALVSRLERGQVPNPTFATLSRYAGAVGLRLNIQVEPVAD
jgi:ribosome-binding protein aMBF1 (putative translation factor)